MGNEPMTTTEVLKENPQTEAREVAEGEVVAFIQARMLAHGAIAASFEGKNEMEVGRRLRIVRALAILWDRVD